MTTTDEQDEVQETTEQMCRRMLPLESVTQPNDIQEDVPYLLYDYDSGYYEAKGDLPVLMALVSFATSGQASLVTTQEDYDVWLVEDKYTRNSNTGSTREQALRRTINDILCEWEDEESDDDPF